MTDEQTTTEVEVDSFDAQIEQSIADAADIGMGNAEQAASEPASTAESTGESSAEQSATPSAEPVSTAQSDAKGNLLDDQQQVVARAGAERRLYERATKLERENENLQGLLAQQNNTSRTRGLTDAEHQFGVDFVVQMKNDPAAATRWLLQETMKRGINLKDIVGNVEGMPQTSIDMRALNAMIDEKLQPFVQEREQVQQADLDRQDTRREIEDFANSHDNAQVHFPLIAELVHRDPNLSLERAYYEVKLFAHTNQLDFSQPLQAQMAAQQQAPVQNAPVQNAPLPGSGNGAAGASTVAVQNPLARANDDWDSIVRQSMAEAGMS